jgi:hypothetical protein
LAAVLVSGFADEARVERRRSMEKNGSRDEVMTNKQVVVVSAQVELAADVFVLSPKSASCVAHSPS